MPTYNSPGVYIQDVVSGIQTIDQASSSIGALIGKTKSGAVGVAVKIGSWTEFVSKFASGLETPFMENSFLPYSVYGFFQNGGKELYVVSVKKNAVKASATGSYIKATALSEGVWGNNIHIQLKRSSDYSSSNLSYDVVIALGQLDNATDSVTITDVYIDTIEEAVNNNIKVKGWLSSFSLVSNVTALDVEILDFAGGTDGDSLTDTDYINALSALDYVDDVTMVGVPGQTSAVMNDAIMSYCDNKELFPILDFPIATLPEDAKATRRGMSAFTGCICYPWGRMNDPLTDTLKTVPTCGHVMGVYARTIENRGVFKAPAGIDAVVRGFIEMEQQLTESNVSTLNPIGVVCILSKPNAGIVIWGARSLNGSDTTMRYVSDGLLNLNIKRSLYNGTQFAVFEPNDKPLWSIVDTSCRAFLEMLRQQGALKGEAEEAYYVRVDESNNTDETILAGQLNIEIGYAPVKPAEFVIIKLAHSIVSQE